MTIAANAGTSSSSSSSSSPFPPPTIRLNDGNFMPQIGLGVYQAQPGENTYQIVKTAITEVGYRLIDTATVYENEYDVGRAVIDSGIPRSQIFITTKLDSSAHGYENAIEATKERLRLLNTTYIDLLLIHSPHGGKLVETWDALIALKRRGLVKSIGVSNFGIPHLEALKGHGRMIPPAVNQIEMHPLIYQERKQLVEYCQQHDIAITAYGSLFYGQVQRFQHPFLQQLATKYQKTVPQILLRWGLQMGFAIIPKTSSSKQRLIENRNILDFEMSAVDVVALSKGLDGEPPLNAYWNPVQDAPVDIGDLSHYESEECGNEL